MQKTDSSPRSKRFPYWLRQTLINNKDEEDVRQLLKELGLNTVCQSAVCPNIYECFSKKICTFLILGEYCTRSCRFCAVKTKKKYLERPGEKEILNIIEAIKKLNLERIVITSVTRDDLEDGGAGHFALCIQRLKNAFRDLEIEVLVPDFLGDKGSIETVVNSGPDVFAHNIETVPRLYEQVRPEADYKRSLRVLEEAKNIRLEIVIKSGLMLGLREKKEEVLEVMNDLKSIGCDNIVLGQYLRPNKDCIEVDRFLEPKEFEDLKLIAEQFGFKKVTSRPFARSSIE
ncbi:MAG: lipoyl synthase [Candidatus Omnitrophota bacterium]